MVVTSGFQLNAGSIVSLVMPCMLLVVVNIRLNVNCGEERTLSMDFELNSAISILTELIENFTYVMDLQVDEKLFNSTSSKFKSMLNSIAIEHGRRPLPGMSGLLHSALLGAYKVKCHTIKDKLSKSHESTLEDEIHSIAPWNTLLLQYLLDYSTVDVDEPSSLALSPLDLAIKLQNIEAAEMILLKRGTVCESFTPLKCSNALHYATINNNLRDLEFLMSNVKLDYLNQTSNTNLTLSLADSLISDTHAYDSTFTYSPLQVSIVHCLVGFSCSMYSYLSSYLSPTHRQLSLPSRALHSQTCSVSETDINAGARTWYINPNQVSGWRLYSGFQIGKNNGCDLPRINIHDDDFLEEFQRLFVDLGYVGAVANSQEYHGTVIV